MYDPSSGNLTVVSELLRGGYRSIDAKNEAGQTAIHLAASLGNTVILKLLIQGGGNVNIKDDLEMTPLHVKLFLLTSLVVFFITFQHLLGLQSSKQSDVTGILNNGRNFHDEVANHLSSRQEKIR